MKNKILYTVISSRLFKNKFVENIFIDWEKLNQAVDTESERF